MTETTLLLVAATFFTVFFCVLFIWVGFRAGDLVLAALAEEDRFLLVKKMKSWRFFVQHHQKQTKPFHSNLTFKFKCATMKKFS